MSFWTCPAMVFHRASGERHSRPGLPRSLHTIIIFTYFTRFRTETLFPQIQMDPAFIKIILGLANGFTELGAVLWVFLFNQIILRVIGRAASPGAMVILSIGPGAEHHGGIAQGCSAGYQLPLRRARELVSAGSS